MESGLKFLRKSAGNFLYPQAFGYFIFVMFSYWDAPALVVFLMQKTKKFRFEKECIFFRTNFEKGVDKLFLIRYYNQAH